MGGNKSKPTINVNQNKKSNIASLPVYVKRVHIKGLIRTKNDYISRSVENLFNVKTYEDLNNEIYITRNDLLELNAFKDVHVRIDAIKSLPNSYEITFENKELSRITGNIGTEIGQNEGSVKSELAAPNIFGRGERISINTSYSNYKTADFSFKLSKPYLHTKNIGVYKPILSLNLFRHITNHTWSSYKTRNDGFLIDFSFVLPSLNIQNSFQYELSMRELSIIGKQIPFVIREESGLRLASVLRHICQIDRRDDRIFPTNGIYINSTNEIAGYGGDIGYVMNNTHAEANVKLSSGIVAQACGRIGLIQGDKNKRSVPISSLFLLGGPLSLRGFQTAGAINHINGCALGTTTYWALGLHLWSYLPFDSYFGDFGRLFRIHGFYNFGNSDTLSLTNMRSAIGAGLAFRLGGMARIELNYVIPLNYNETDFIQRGIQFGVGYEFI